MGYCSGSVETSRFPADFLLVLGCLLVHLWCCCCCVASCCTRSTLWLWFSLLLLLCCATAVGFVLLLVRLLVCFNSYGLSRFWAVGSCLGAADVLLFAELCSICCTTAVMCCSNNPVHCFC